MPNSNPNPTLILMVKNKGPIDTEKVEKDTIDNTAKEPDAEVLRETGLPMKIDTTGVPLVSEKTMILVLHDKAKEVEAQRKKLILTLTP